MPEPLFTIRLTRKELWALWQNAAAAFVDEAEMSVEDRSSIEKVAEAYAKSL